MALERIERFLARAQSPSERVASVILSWAIRYELSDAEADILARACRGESREAIASQRNASEATIQKQISTLLRRTGDDTLKDAVARVLIEVAHTL